MQLIEFKISFSKFSLQLHFCMWMLIFLVLQIIYTPIWFNLLILFVFFRLMRENVLANQICMLQNDGSIWKIKTLNTEFYCELEPNFIMDRFFIILRFKQRGSFSVKNYTVFFDSMSDSNWRRLRVLVRFGVYANLPKKTIRNY